MAAPKRAAPVLEGNDPLALYNAKRNFAITSEPAGVVGTSGPTLGFVIQKHAATRLHYDLRLELDGVLLSWAMPRRPNFDPLQKRMAVRTEAHPLEYADFEGTIPAKQFGGGTMIVWDRGTWEPTVDPHEGLAKGKLIFKLHGQKLAGLWELVRIQKRTRSKSPDDVQEARRVGTAHRCARCPHRAPGQRAHPTPASRLRRPYMRGRYPSRSINRRASGPSLVDLPSPNGVIPALVQTTRRGEFSCSTGAPARPTLSTALERRAW